MSLERSAQGIPSRLIHGLVLEAGDLFLDQGLGGAFRPLVGGQERGGTLAFNTLGFFGFGHAQGFLGQGTRFHEGDMCIGPGRVSGLSPIVRCDTSAVRG